MKIPEYNSFADKNPHFSLVGTENSCIDTKENLEKWIKSVSENENLIFRGMNEAKYKIYSSVQRAFLDGHINSHFTISSFVQEEITKLQSNKILTDYYKAIHIPITDFIYISFLQHYGAPSPFIDFSHNVFKALYFATENVRYGNGNSSTSPLIDDYFSVYWIDIKECGNELLDIKKLYREGYIKGIELIQQYKGHDINTENLTNLRKYLAWNNPENTKGCMHTLLLGYIDSKYKYRHYGIGNKPDAASRIYTLVKSLSKDYNSQKYQQLVNCVTYMFDETIKIANMNLVAQEGCFILYNPNNYTNVGIEDPLEYAFEKKDYLPQIYCVNIHKSLAPYLIDKNKQKHITQKEIYPDNRNIAQNAYNDSLINL